MGCATCFICVNWWGKGWPIVACPFQALVVPHRMLPIFTWYEIGTRYYHFRRRSLYSFLFDSNNDLCTFQRLVITWTNADFFWILPFEVMSNFYQIIEFSCPRMHLACRLHKWQLFWATQLYQWTPGSAFIKPDQRNPWINDQLGNALLSIILHLQLPNCVQCVRDKPSHTTQNLVTVCAKL